MSERGNVTMTKRHTLERIRYYLNHHDTVHFSFEKLSYYEWAIKEACREIKTSMEPPLDVLDRLLIKYDEWAHTTAKSAEAFKVASTAIEDLIDLLIAG